MQGIRMFCDRFGTGRGPLCMLTSKDSGYWSKCFGWHTQLIHQPWGSLTHWGRDKMVAIFQTTVSNAFSWMKMYQFLLTFQRYSFPSRAGVKYVLSNTNTNTNTFFSGVSNTNTNTNTPANIWSNTNTNTNTAHQIQIQIQIHNEAETKLPPFYRWHIEIYCIVRRLFVHSNFTENCF